MLVILAAYFFHIYLGSIPQVTIIICTYRLKKIDEKQMRLWDQKVVSTYNCELVTIVHWPVYTFPPPPMDSNLYRVSVLKSLQVGAHCGLFSIFGR